MTLAFYKVVNSQNYERHTFDDIYDKPKEILKKLSLLKDDEWRTYNVRYSSRVAGIWDFMEDYNDEELDGGWWCIVLPG